MSHERKEHHLTRWDLRRTSVPLSVSFSFFLSSSLSISLPLVLYPERASRYQCVYLIQLQISWILNIPIPYRPHDFWTACLGIRERYIFVGRARWARARLTRPLSLLSLRHLREHPASRLHSRRSFRPLALFSLTISITRMTEWSESKSRRDNLYCNYNEALYAVGIHGRSEVIPPAEVFTRLCSCVSPFLSRVSLALFFTFNIVRSQFHRS